MEKENNVKLDFIGIGAPKSGTTWLVECLSEHPEIYIPPIKEVCFFNSKAQKKNYLKGFSWYNKFFKDAPEKSVKGEFSTHYIHFDDSAELIKKHYPDIKIVASLRRPDKMIYSLYWWKKASFRESEIADSFEEEMENNKTLLKRGNYYEQLKRYYDRFPKDNIHVIIYDDVVKNPEKELKKLYMFLGVDHNYYPEILNKKVNVSKAVRSKLLNWVASKFVDLLKFLDINTAVRNFVSKHNIIKQVYTKTLQKDYKYPPMKSETKRYLRNYYKDDVKKLEKLINKDLSFWEN